MLALARETGVKLQFSHLIFVGARTWRTVDEALRLIDRANAEGLSFHYDSYAMMYGASVITVVLPPWYLTLPESRRRSAAVRARLAVEIGVTKKLLGFDFDDIVIPWAGDQHRDIAGLNVKQIARRWGSSALDTYLQLVADTRGQGREMCIRDRSTSAPRRGFIMKWSDSCWNTAGMCCAKSPCAWTRIRPASWPIWRGRRGLRAR